MLVRQYFIWGGEIYFLQVFERNHFNAWVTVYCTTDKTFADGWKR